MTGSERKSYLFIINDSPYGSERPYNRKFRFWILTVVMIAVYVSRPALLVLYK